MVKRGTKGKCNLGRFLLSVYAHGLSFSSELFKQNGCVSVAHTYSTHSLIKTVLILYLCFVYLGLDPAKDPCLKIKCSRHKVCVAEDYKTASCVSQRRVR